MWTIRGSTEGSVLLLLSNIGELILQITFLLTEERRDIIVSELIA